MSKDYNLKSCNLKEFRVKSKIMAGERQGDTLVTISIDRFSLRAKNYNKQEVQMTFLGAAQDANNNEVSIEPFVELLGRVCLDSMDDTSLIDARKNGQGEFVS